MRAEALPISASQDKVQGRKGNGPWNWDNPNWQTRTSSVHFFLARVCLHSLQRLRS